jgi:hypothetical protein
MAKLIPFSLILMTLLLPGILAARPRGKQAVRTMQIGMAVYIVIWAFLCLYVYTAHILIE